MCDNPELSFQTLTSHYIYLQLRNVIILHLDRRAPSNRLHDHLNILKINDLYKCSVMSFVKTIHNLVNVQKKMEKYFQKKT